MTLASQEISRAKCELFERGWNPTGTLGSEGQICIMVALALGRGLTEQQVLFNGRWADECESAKHVGAAIKELHGDIGLSAPTYAEREVWLWNDLHAEHFDQVIEVLDLAEKKALIAEEAAA